MRIAYISDYSPNDINIWSGTPFYIFKTLSKHHEVVWLGKGLIEGTKWYHTLKGERFPFLIENYTKETNMYLSKLINEGNFDLVLTCSYCFCTELKVHIPVVFYTDVTFDLYRDYMQCKDEYYTNLARKTEKNCLTHVDAVLFSSNWTKADAIERYQLDEKKIHVIEFGANIATPQNIQKKYNAKSVCHIVFVGRNWEKKGGNEVLEAYKILKAQKFPCKLTIIGCKPEDVEMDSDVEVIPWIDKRKDLDCEKYNSIMQDADFLVLPTKFEAYGIVFCEASAYGVPSIAPNVGGVSQPISEGKNGFLLSPSSAPIDYANKIRDTFTDKNFYQKLRKTTRKEFENRLNWDVWYKRFAVIMDQLLNNSNNPLNSLYIPVYAINLPTRTERRKHLLNQFKNKKEFELILVDAVQEKKGTIGLWKSIRKVVQMAQKRHDEIMILCEDDHQFTKHYNRDKFLYNVVQAFKQGADLLCGGIGGYGDAISIASNRFRVNWFYCTQFVVITDKIFQKILDYEFKETDTADGVLSEIIENKQTLFPFVSVQKDFGYSDVTKSNDENRGLIESIFKHTEYRLASIIRLQNNQKQLEIKNKYNQE